MKMEPISKAIQASVIEKKMFIYKIFTIFISNTENFFSLFDAIFFKFILSIKVKINV